ncbi:DUF397 domain-containing protein [Nocardiopsis sp. NPDC007018]|uniref:DUF397 domain-containing protein n=1 Tax=Nocardiopsis sp. NPDC007018 TaxID=3155721 RepID=UPI0033ED5E7E
MRPHTTELTFRKSSYSATSNANCVEVADLTHGSAVRDSQNRDLGTLGFAGPEWSAVLGAIRADQ